MKVTKDGDGNMPPRERIGEELTNWDLTRKRFVATALEIATQTLIRVAQTPTVTTTTETVTTTTTTTANSSNSTTDTTTTTTNSSGTTTDTTATTTVNTAPNAAEVAVLANAIASLVSSIS